nr:MAG TPA: hypothetical protein [Caudoviricetes sp.]
MLLLHKVRASQFLFPLALHLLLQYRFRCSSDYRFIISKTMLTRISRSRSLSGSALLSAVTDFQVN